MGRWRSLECRRKRKCVWNNTDVEAGFFAQQAEWRYYTAEADGQDCKPITGMSRARMRYQQERDCDQQCQRPEPKPCPPLVDPGHLFAQSVAAGKQIRRKCRISINSKAPG